MSNVSEMPYAQSLEVQHMCKVTKDPITVPPPFPKRANG